MLRSFTFIAGDSENKNENSFILKNENVFSLTKLSSFLLHSRLQDPYIFWVRNLPELVLILLTSCPSPKYCNTILFSAPFYLKERQLKKIQLNFVQLPLTVQILVTCKQAPEKSPQNNFSIYWHQPYAGIGVNT